MSRHSAVRRKAATIRWGKAVPVGNTWLSKRQHQVMTMYSRGTKRAEIARRIAISDRTVDSHVRNTLQRLGARNIHEAVAIVAVSNALDAIQPNRGRRRSSNQAEQGEPPIAVVRAASRQPLQ